MAERSVVVRLRAEVSGYKAAMDEAARATRKVPDEAKRADTALGRMVQSAERNRQAWTTAGTTLTAFGAATVGALGYATNAAMKWESAWTGVVKTVDGSADELSRVEDGLRSMARTLPSTHEEIAAVAAAAGQLGIETPNVVGFTKVMIDLGQSTNLAAEEAAVGLARFSNVMGTSQTDASRLGSVLVDLGNNFATTESEILAMGQRLAAAGRIVGLTESQTLGLAAAMSSVGIEAEAGGSAVSRVMIAVSKAVDEGGDDLDAFARAASMTADGFAAKWRTDPVNALLAVVGGLARMTQSGRGTFAMLDELGLRDIRVTNAMLSLSNAVDLTTDAVDMASRAWDQNTALLVEAEKRYDTAESKIAIAKNSLNDTAIVIGQFILPAIAGLADGVADLAQWFGSLPEPVLGTVTALAGVVGAAATLGGGFLLLFPRIMDVRNGFATLREDGNRIPGVMTGIGKAVGAAAAAYAGFSIVTGVLKSIADDTDRLRLSAAQATEALLDTQQVQDLDAAFDGLGIGADRVTGIEDAFRRITSPGFLDRMQDFGGTIRGVFNWDTTARSATLDQIDALGQGLATLVSSGHADKAASQFQILQDAWVRAGGSADELIALMPAYRDALASASTEEKLAGENARGFAGGLDEIDPAVQAAQDALAEWQQMVADANSTFIDLSGAWDSVIQKNKDWAQSVADSTKNAEDSWETYYDGQTVSTTDYIAQLEAQVAAQQQWRDNILALSERTRDGLTGDMRAASEAMIDELISLGPEGAEKVALFASMTDEEFAKLVTLWSQKGVEAAAGFVSQVEGYRDPQMTLLVDTVGAQAAADGFIRANNGRRITFTVGASGQVNYRVTGTGLQFFDGGGYTGNLPAKNIAGFVHGDEHVISSPSRRSIEAAAPGYLDSLNRLGARALRGYEGGGYVEPPRYVAPTWSTPATAGVRAVREVHAPIYVSSPDPVSAGIEGARYVQRLAG